ncbi:MAG: class I SAM-dependent methyltransferase [Acidimicrobiales bacterium]
MVSLPTFRSIGDTGRVSPQDFDSLVHHAASAQRAGWDFSYLHGRTTGGELPWSFRDLAHPLLDGASRLLDQDTGGGEALASIGPLPAYVVATEAWQPNVAVAKHRLEPLGVEVRRQFDPRIPASDGEFDLVMNRHGQIDPGELARVLDTGGRLLTQQVGAGNDGEFNGVLGTPIPSDGPTGDRLADSLSRVGFRVTRVESVAVPATYLDIGAVVFQLLAVPWQVPGFTVKGLDTELRALDRQIRTDGGFTVHDHRILVLAVKS